MVWPFRYARRCMVRGRMPGEGSMREVLRNLLHYGDLSFRDFVELALYHPEHGYYATHAARVGKGGDYVTSPSLSPVFAYALSGLVAGFLHRSGARVSTIVDIGCGDGSLIHSLYASERERRAREGEEGATEVRFVGVDRSLERVTPREGVDFFTTLDAVPKGDTQLVISNTPFDALPFARRVQRGEDRHE